MGKISNILRNIRRKKCIHLDCLKSEMKRCIGTWTLTILAIANILGCSLYIVTAEVTRATGPSAVFSYLFAGISVFIISMCISEFAVRFPKAGSVYYYSYVAFGELCAFFTGWNACFEKLITCAAIAKAQSNFINYLSDSAIQNFTIEYILNGNAWDHPVLVNYPDFVASFIVIVVCIVLALGTELSYRVSTAFVVINVFVILTILSTGVYYANVSVWADNGGFFPQGARGVIFGVTSCFWVFTGFDDITSYSEEIINPANSIPIATNVGIGATGVINIIVILVISLVQPFQEIDQNSMLTSVFTSHSNTWMSIVIVVGVMTTVAGIIVTLSAVARIIQNMAADGLIFKSLALIDKRTLVPARSTISLGLICSIMAMLFDVVKLVEFSVLSALSAYLITSIGVIIIRYRDPNVNGFNSPSPTQYGNNNEYALLFTSSNKTKLNGKQKFKINLTKYYIDTLLESYSVELIATWCVTLIVLLLIAIFVVLVHFHNFLWIQPNLCVIMLMCFMCFATAILLLVLAQCKELNIPTGYKVPMTPYIPLLAVIINIIFILLMKPITWICFFCWNSVGLLLYIFYGYRYSIERLTETPDEQTPLLTHNIVNNLRNNSDNFNTCYSSYESTI